MSCQSILDQTLCLSKNCDNSFVSAEEEMKMKSLTLFFFGIFKIAVALVSDPKAPDQNVIKIEGKN